MEPQNKVILDTIFPAFCFQVFLRFFHVDGVGGMLPTPKHEPTVIMVSEWLIVLFVS